MGQPRPLFYINSIRASTSAYQRTVSYDDRQLWRSNVFNGTVYVTYRAGAVLRDFTLGDPISFSS